MTVLSGRHYIRLLLGGPPLPLPGAGRFLGIKRLGGCFGRFTGCAGREFCVGFGPLSAVGSLTAGKVALDLGSEDCTAGFGGIEETSGVVAEG